MTILQQQNILKTLYLNVMMINFLIMLHLKKIKFMFYYMKDVIIKELMELHIIQIKLINKYFYLMN